MYLSRTNAVSITLACVVLFGARVCQASLAPDVNTTLAPYFVISGDGETGAGTDHFPLKQTSLHARLDGIIAGVTVTQVYRNEGAAPINARYVFPGSTHAAVNALTMTIGDRRITATIREKEEAARIFETAKVAGKSASLLAQKRPNVFTMDVANILPGDEVIIELRYTELLVADEGVYEFVAPGVVGPRYGGDAGASGQETAWVGNPYLQQGTADPVGYDIAIEIVAPVPVRDLQSPSHDIDVRWQSRTAGAVALRQPAIDAGNRDFILRYRLQDNAIMSGISTFTLGDENYFLLVAEPPQRLLPEERPAREYLFIVDVSGSMHGFPLDVSREVIDAILDDLRPNDSFNILFFAGGTRVLAPAPLPANAANLQAARDMLRHTEGIGGTELMAALRQGLAMPVAEGVSRSIVILTDGLVAADDAALELLDRNLGRSNVFAFGIGASVNRFLIEGLARVGRAESFVVTNAAEARREAERFRQYIAAPVLTNIRVGGDQVEVYDVEPAAHPDLLAQRSLVVLGKYRNDGYRAALTLHGVTGHGEREWRFPLRDASFDPNLPQLWARKRLEQLDFSLDGPPQRAAILDLGLRYSLLTRYTSFVAVDERVRNATPEGTREVKQPLPLPQGVAASAVGGGLRPMPEPDLVWLLVAGAALAIARRWYRREPVGAGR